MEEEKKRTIDKEKTEKGRESGEKQVWMRSKEKKKKVGKESMWVGKLGC